MKNYNYNLLLCDLSDGREIEFKYMGDLYGIIHSPKGWHFVCNNNRISKFYDNPRNLVMNISVNEKSLEEVFNSGDIFEEGFYIL